MSCISYSDKVNEYCIMCYNLTYSYIQYIGIDPEAISCIRLKACVETITHFLKLIMSTLNLKMLVCEIVQFIK